MWLSKVSIHRPVFMTMVIGVLMILGIVGYTRLPVDLFPEVSLPIISVIIPYPGAGPAQVEEDVVKPLEDAVAGIGGLEETFGTARESVGIVTLAFKMGTPVDEVSNELRDRVFRLKTSLPEGVMDPMLYRIDPNATPVMTLAVGAGADLVATRDLADRIVKPALERVEGVGAVNIMGGETEEVHLELDLPKMAELRIPLLQVAQQVGIDIIDIPGGNMQVGSSRLGLRARGQPRSLEELGSIVVQGFPQPIYLRDIARVARAPAEQTILTRVDGIRAVTLEVIKESGSNTVAVCNEIREAAAKMRLPAGVTLAPVIDTSDIARDMVHEMQRALIIGAIMAVLVVYLFMVDWRSTFISGLALPTSIISTFFFMWVAGFSLNILSLIALSLAIGVLIDDAVVVREVIFRHLEQGEDPVTASIRGTSEVALAVLATTLSILAVFVPVGFMQGIVGQFFGQFGITVAIAVSVSLFIAFTVDPMLSSRISKVVRPEDRSPAARALLRFMGGVDRSYVELLSWALDHGKTVIAASLALFLVSLGMVAVTGTEFIPNYDRSAFEVETILAPSTSLQSAESTAEELEGILRQTPEVTHVYTVVGQEGSADIIKMRVQVPPKGDRDRSIYEIQDEVRSRVSNLPGINVGVRDPSILEGGQTGVAIEVEIRGQEISDLQTVADQVRVGMTRIRGAVNVQSTYRSPRPELQLDVDRDKAAAAGLSVGQGGIALRMAVAGQVVGRYRDEGRTLDVRLLARPEDRTPKTLLSSILLLSPLPRLDDPHGRGTPVALQDIARLENGTAPGTIERHDRQRRLVVSCSLAGRALSDVQGDIQKMLDGMDKPPGVDTQILGMADVASDALKDLLFALGLAIVFVYAVLASQYESFIHPFTIMLSLPLAVVGAFATVFLVGWPIGILTMLGIILLMGLVTKNAILLVDRANQLRLQGHSAREAMLVAGKVRLRPILMTSLAMVLGMLPPAISQGPGSEIQQPMALPVIGGLIASTLLTLVVVPVVYMWIEALRERLRKPSPPLPLQQVPVSLPDEEIP